nr:hypothetical protein GCM10025732_33880 [Glycomyces mayteni]
MVAVGVEAARAGDVDAAALEGPVGVPAAHEDRDEQQWQQERAHEHGPGALRADAAAVLEADQARAGEDRADRAAVGVEEAVDEGHEDGEREDQARGQVLVHHGQR